MIAEEAAKALRAPFPESAIGKLPRGNVKLDFVGHAHVTDRLLAVDPEWSWEPVAFAEDGAPLIRHGDKDATLWIRLTVCGVTRLGVGSVALGSFELDKQLISDAIRNAAMRFGVALDLWAKEPLGDVDPDTGEIKTSTTRRRPTPMPGFDTMAEQRKAHEAYEQLAAAQSETIREALKRWRADEKLPYPMSRGDLSRASAVLDLAIMREQASGVVRDEDEDRPAQVPDEPVASTPDQSLAEGAGTSDGPAHVEETLVTPLLDLEGSPSANSRGYDGWTRIDLMAECAARDIDAPANAVKATLIEKLRAWDRAFNSDAFEPEVRQF